MFGIVFPLIAKLLYFVILSSNTNHCFRKKHLFQINFKGQEFSATFHDILIFHVKFPKGTHISNVIMEYLTINVKIFARKSIIYNQQKYLSSDKYI